MNKTLIFILMTGLVLACSCDQKPETDGNHLLSFGEGGQIKMLYDRRQRPQSVYLNNKVHIVFNAVGKKGAPAGAPTKPMAITYDPSTGEFSDIVTLGPGAVFQSTVSKSGQQRMEIQPVLREN